MVKIHYGRAERPRREPATRPLDPAGEAGDRRLALVAAHLAVQRVALHGGAAGGTDGAHHLADVALIRTPAARPRSPRSSSSPCRWRRRPGPPGPA